MRATQAQSRVEDKPQARTQTLQEAYGRSTPYGKPSRKWRETMNAVLTYLQRPEPNLHSKIYI